VVGDHLLLRDTGPYGIIFMNVCCYSSCHDNALKGLLGLTSSIYKLVGWLSFAVKGSWALWKNIYDYACLLHIFPSVSTGNLLVST
jgi:hypothetical protein